jgi:hypothetical protein
MKAVWVPRPAPLYFMELTRHNTRFSGLELCRGDNDVEIHSFKVFLMNLGHNLGRDGVMMRLILKTRWLLPILMVGLAILAIEPPIWASDQTLVEVTSGTEPTATGLDLALIDAEAPAESEAAFDDTAYGTY